MSMRIYLEISLLSRWGSIRNQKLLTSNMYQSTGNDAKRLENTFTRRAYSRPDRKLWHDLLTFWRFFANLTQQNTTFPVISFRNFSPA